MAIRVDDDEDFTGNGQQTFDTTASEVMPDLPDDPSSPLNEPRVDRPHSTAPKDFHGAVPEPEPPPEGMGGGAGGLDDDEDFGEGSSSGGGGESGKESGAGGAGGVKDAPPLFKARSAKNLASWAIRAYADHVPKLFKWVATVPQKKLDALSMSGEVDFTLPVQMPTGQVLSSGSYIMQVNEGIKNENGFNVSEDWKTELKPYLVRWMEEKQIGLTDGETVAMMLAEDLGLKIALAVSIKMQIASTLSFFKEQTAQNRKPPTPPTPAPSSGSSGVPPPPPPQPAAPQAAAQPTSPTAAGQQVDKDGVITVTEVETVPND